MLDWKSGTMGFISKLSEMSLSNQHLTRVKSAWIHCHVNSAILLPALELSWKYTLIHLLTFMHVLRPIEITLTLSKKQGFLWVIYFIRSTKWLR